MKKFMMSKKRNLSESSEDPDDPAAIGHSPSRGGLPSPGGYNPPGFSASGVYNPPTGGFNPLGGAAPGFSASGVYNPPPGGFNPLGGVAAVATTEQYYKGLDYSTDGGVTDSLGFKRPKLEPVGRRQSQASTTSSVSESEESALDRDAQSLSRALESTSSSDTEDETVHHQGFSGTKPANQNGSKPNYAATINKEPPKPKTASSSGPAATSYSSQAERMMSMMGYKSGTGLGKAQQGRVEPVGLSSQKGRRGLGHIIEGLESSDEIDWTPEEVVVREPVNWIKTNLQPAPTFEELRHWVGTGARNTDISGETTFCDSNVLKDVLSCKSVFDKLEAHEMMKARSRSNPYETIAKGIFQNRAAMKMANMDTVFDFMFTSPVGEDGKSLVKDDEPLYFADVCAGPGGFSEYVLWKRQWRAKGYGFTLRDGKHDFKLEDFYAGPPEGFEPYYGVDGVKGDGNVFRSENIKELERFVLENSHGRGVHFMMADGGFSVEGSENIQEILSKQLYLCQCIVALAIVRTKGHFVCKLFDLFTPFSVGLVYLMYRSFEQVCIHKPNTSRPANSERYIVCKWKRPDTDNILQYLFQVNQILTDLKFDITGRTRSDTDVLHIVPENIISSDTEFLNYLVESNNQIGHNQVTGLEKIAIFYRNRNLYEKRQAEVRKESLEFWNVPDQGRIRPRIEEPQQMAARLVSDGGIFRHEEAVIKTPDDLRKHIKSVYDWRYVVVGTQDSTNISTYSSDNQESRAFLISTGRQRVYYKPASGTKWISVGNLPSCKLELPAETLLFVELVWEMKGESKAQKKVMSVQVIDALFLGGEDVRSLHFMERHRRASLFVKVMNKPSRSDLVRIKVKALFKLEELVCETSSLWTQLERRLLKGRGEALVLSNTDPEPDGSYKFFQAKGLMAYKHVRDPYIMALSKSQKRKYFFNTRTGQAAENFSTPSDSIAEFDSCHTSRLIWYWGSSPDNQNNGVTKEDFEQFVHEKLSGR